jgi:hypothetical protein
MQNPIIKMFIFVIDDICDRSCYKHTFILSIIEKCTEILKQRKMSRDVSVMGSVVSSRWSDTPTTTTKIPRIIDLIGIPSEVFRNTRHFRETNRTSEGELQRGIIPNRCQLNVICERNYYHFFIC